MPSSSQLQRKAKQMEMPVMLKFLRCRAEGTLCVSVHHKRLIQLAVLTSARQ